MAAMGLPHGLALPRLDRRDLAAMDEMHGVHVHAQGRVCPTAGASNMPYAHPVTHAPTEQRRGGERGKGRRNEGSGLKEQGQRTR